MGHRCMLFRSKTKNRETKRPFRQISKSNNNVRKVSNQLHLVNANTTQYKTNSYINSSQKNPRNYYTSSYSIAYFANCLYKPRTSDIISFFLKNKNCLRGWMVNKLPFRSDLHFDIWYFRQWTIIQRTNSNHLDFIFKYPPIFMYRVFCPKEVNIVYKLQ